MTRPRRSIGSSPAEAGSLLIGTWLACAGVALGVGELVGAPVPFAIAGALLGPVAGTAVVRSRYRDV